MVALQDRILLLFDDEHPARSSREIADVLGIPHDEAKDELRCMEQKRLVYTMEHQGKIAVILKPDGEAAREALLTTPVQTRREPPGAAVEPE